MISLGIDAGGSSTRWLLRSEEAELARGRLPTRSGPLYDDESRRETFARFEKIAAEVLEIDRPQAVVAGVAGLDEGTEAAVELSRVIETALGPVAPLVRVVNDMRIAYRSVFDPAGGVLLYAGTGSIASFEQSDGRLLRAGGHGYLIDDAGGGFWIGSQALRAVLREADSTGRLFGALADAICGELDARDWPAIRSAVYGAGRSRVASLAPAVAAAANAGDAQAQAILAAAGTELGRLPVLLFGVLGRQLPVAFSGGISKLSPLLHNAVRAALPDGSELRVVDVEPVEAAARMALALAGQARESNP